MKIQIGLVYGLALCFVFTGCNDPKKPNVELIQDMMESPALKEQDFDPSDPNGKSVRTPPEGTVPQGYKPYLFKGKPLEAEAKLVNPLKDDFSPETLSLGKAKFEIYCSVCHGHQGAGDGTVAEKMALKPPSLLSSKIVDYKDGRIFHIITDGQGVMLSYQAQIPGEKERWAIVNYVRHLQKTKGVAQAK